MGIRRRSKELVVVKRKPDPDPGLQVSKPERAPSLHDQLVQRAAQWLKGSCGCSAVLTELRAFNASGECPDAVGWRSNYSILVECKTTRSDFKADQRKHFKDDPRRGVGTYRFYLCPPGIIDVNDLPNGWGLLYAEPRKISRIAGPQGNSWGYGQNRDWIQPRNTDAEIAMLVSALRRTGET